MPSEQKAPEQNKPSTGALPVSLTFGFRCTRRSQLQLRVGLIIALP